MVFAFFKVLFFSYLYVSKGKGVAAPPKVKYLNNYIMSTKKTQSGKAEKTAPELLKKAVTATKETPKEKTVPELIEEQKQFFQRKNGILKKLNIFERKGEDLQKVVSKIEDNTGEESSLFEDSRTFSVIFKDSYNEICTISKPVVIKEIISATLAKIDESRHSLETELLSE